MLQLGRRAADVNEGPRALVPLFVHVCVCVRARACVFVCVCVCCMHACVRAYVPKRVNNVPECVCDQQQTC